MSVNMPGLEVLEEEKEPDTSYIMSSNVDPGNESLLPPLPSSSTSLPLKQTSDSVEQVPNGSGPANIDSYQVSTASLESMLYNVDLDSTKPLDTHIPDPVPTFEKVQIAGATNGHTVESHTGGSLDKNLSGSLENHTAGSANIDTLNSTRQGSVSSINSSVSGISNKAVLKRIKSGLRKLSSPLSASSSSSNVKDLEQQNDSTPEMISTATPVFKRPFLPSHKSTLSNTSNSSSTSSLNPLSGNKHSHTNSSTSNKTTEIFSNLMTTPLSSPVITVNEKFGSRVSSDGSEYQHQLQMLFGSDSLQIIDRSTLDQFDTIEEKVAYIDSMKKQMENEDAAYEITERRLLNSGWATETDLSDLRLRRQAASKHWKENINTLESILYRINQ